MPHDCNGNVLRVGDIVDIPCRVAVIHEGEDYCNVNLETIYPMYPESALTVISLNTKQVELKDAIQ
jgi:hypothetical protein